MRSIHGMSPRTDGITHHLPRSGVRGDPVTRRPVLGASAKSAIGAQQANSRCAPIIRYGDVSAPEDARWISIELRRQVIDAAWPDVVIGVPTTVPVGPMQGPRVIGSPISELSDRHLRPFGQAFMPGRPAFEDGDDAPSNGDIDPCFVSQLGRHPTFAVLANLGEVDVRR